MSEYVKPLSDHAAEHGAIPRIVVKHPSAQAELYLQGGHLARWKPEGEAAVLFVSPLAKFVPGGAIRGGVPVCFPWFGFGPGNDQKPQHGFARTSVWTLVGQQDSANGVTLHLRLASDEKTRAHWPHDFVADLHFAIGRTLEMKLSVTNTGDTPCTFEEALHTYYAVSDVRHVSVGGLTGTDYLDKPDNFTRKTEAEPAIRFTAETDRVYLNTTAASVIDDPGEKRKIVIEKENSRDTVVWNPSSKVAEGIKDLGAANWTPFVCVETANVGPNAITLVPGKSHTMTCRVRVERE